MPCPEEIFTAKPYRDFHLGRLIVITAPTEPQQDAHSTSSIPKDVANKAPSQWGDLSASLEIAQNSSQNHTDASDEP